MGLLCQDDLFDPVRCTNPAQEERNAFGTGTGAVKQDHSTHERNPSISRASLAVASS